VTLHPAAFLDIQPPYITLDGYPPEDPLDSLPFYPCPSLGTSNPLENGLHELLIQDGERSSVRGEGKRQSILQMRTAE